MIALLSHLDCIENSEILNLVVTNSINKSESLFLLVGFNTPHEMQIRIFGHFLNQFSHLFSDFDTKELFDILTFHSFQLLLKNGLENLALRLGEFVYNILSQKVFVFIPKSLDHVLNLAWRMLDDKGIPNVRGVGRWEMFVGFVIFSDIC